MSGNLTQDTLEGFACALARKESVPGGGAAAAYAGALGVALGAMAGAFTLGKRRYAEHEDDVRRMLDDAARIRERLVALVDEDARAFRPLAQAYAIGRDDPARAEAVEAATAGALEPPLEMMRATCEAIALLEEMGEKGSRMLLSDVGCGALLCRASLEAAALNVLVNTASLADRALAASVEADVDAMLAEYAPRAEACAARVTDHIRGRG